MRVYRLTTSDGGGYPVYEHRVVEGLESVPCRLDLTFIRPGKDQLPVVEAGRAPDHLGIMFCDPDVPIQAGDVYVFFEGPISGTYEMRVSPDRAIGFKKANHIEVQLVETTLQSVDYSQPRPEIPEVSP
jgi:hypothetical protein